MSRTHGQQSGLCEHYWNNSDGCFECYCTGCSGHLCECDADAIPLAEDAYCEDCMERVCIGCGCTDISGCWDGEDNQPCTWIRTDDRQGLCSACWELDEAWDQGDRTPRVPIETEGD